jgi:hypothetical protein
MVALSSTSSIALSALSDSKNQNTVLIYFLRADDDRVLVVYDPESQSLGAGGEDPLASAFRPRTELMMARAPATKYVLDKRFTGNLMDLGEPVELAASPKEWPEQDQLCQIPWDHLEKRLGNPAL